MPWKQKSLPTPGFWLGEFQGLYIRVRHDWVINATSGRTGWEKNKFWVCNWLCQIYTEEGDGEGDELAYQIISKIQREREKQTAIHLKTERRLPWWFSAEESTWQYRGPGSIPGRGRFHRIVAWRPPRVTTTEPELQGLRVATSEPTCRAGLRTKRSPCPARESSPTRWN